MEKETLDYVDEHVETQDFFALLQDRLLEESLLQIIEVQKKLRFAIDYQQEVILEPLLARIEFAVDALTGLCWVEETDREAIDPIINEYGEWEIPHEEVIRFNE